VTNEDRVPLILEAKRIQDDSLHTATAHFISSGWLWWGNIILGTLPIVLGAVGGFKGFTDPAHATQATIYWATFSAFIAGSLGSVLAFWNLAERRSRHETAATQFKSLQHGARRAHEIHAASESFEDFKRRVIDLGDRYDKLNESHLQTADWAFKRAQKKIRAGTYESDAVKSPGQLPPKSIS
jgi:hypothetical protein